MATATLRALAAQWALEGDASMDHLTVNSGFLQVAEAIPASHKALHKYKKLNALPSFTVSNPGGSRGDTTTDDNVFDNHLKIVAANESEPADILEDWDGGASAYFAAQRPSYLEAFGQAVSNIMFYGDNATFGNVTGFRGLHQIAKANSKVTQCGGASGSRNTIFAVKFRSGSNGCGVLYDNAITGGGDIMESEVLNGGQKVLEVTNTTGNQKKEVYQVVHKGKMSFLSTSVYDVAALTQIENAATDLPTADRIDTILDAVRASGNTFLFMNRATRRMVNALNASALSTDPGTTDFYSWLTSWNGIPIIIDDNLLSTETTALD